MSNRPKTPENSVCGIDEVGRGPLAGPVTAAAVLLPRGFPVDQLDDSKKLTPARRRRLRERLIGAGAAYGIGHASPSEIDALNIHRATLLAMRRAWDALVATTPEAASIAVAVDGKFCPELPTKCRAIIGGDALEPAIMAASIIAKTERDAIMIAYHDRWPHYAFDRNKGYPTEAHRAALRILGPTPIHRRSFRGVEATVDHSRRGLRAELADREGSAAPADTDRSTDAAPLRDADDGRPAASAPERS